MADRSKFDETDKAVSAAISTLESEARDNAAQYDQPDKVEKEIAYSLLTKAQMHAREVAQEYDAQSRQDISEARDILQEHYAKPENTDKSRYDLEHCESALEAMDRGSAKGRRWLAGYVERLKGERGPSQDRGLDRDSGRDRER